MPSRADSRTMLRIPFKQGFLEKKNELKLKKFSLKPALNVGCTKNVIDDEVECYLKNEDSFRNGQILYLNIVQVRMLCAINIPYLQTVASILCLFFDLTFIAHSPEICFPCLNFWSCFEKKPDNSEIVFHNMLKSVEERIMKIAKQ